MCPPAAADHRAAYIVVMTGATPSDVESGARPEPVGGTVVIFRSAMLAGSETVIRNQGMALTRWRPAEAVAHGETGLLCGEGDRLGLARNIQPLLSDEALRDRLGRQARHRVEQRFDLARQTRVLEDLYDTAARHVT